MPRLLAIRLFALTAAVLIVGAGTTVLVTQELVAADTPTRTEATLVEVIDKALPAVVSVVGMSTTNGERAVVGRGTGFIVSKDGLVITNRHVVQSDALTYRVYLSDGRRYTAKVLGRDPLYDLALLQLPVTGVPALPLGDSEKLKIGHTVIAIGNSLGLYSNSVTQGIIGGLNRSLAAGNDATGELEPLEELIQTDAAINQGNSGGPLLNTRGEVVGINTAVVRGGQGLGFAIPVNEAKHVLASYRTNKRVVRSYLGVRYVSVTPDLQETNRLSHDYGALVNEGSARTAAAVVPGSPADKAGLLRNDLILSVNGTLIRGQTSLRKIVGRHEPGSTIKLAVSRNGRVIEVSVTLAEAPATP